MTTPTLTRTFATLALVALVGLVGLSTPVEAGSTYSCAWLDNCDTVCTSPFVIIDPIGPCSDGYGNFASAQCPNGDLYLCRQTS